MQNFLVKMEAISPHTGLRDRQISEIIIKKEKEEIKTLCDKLLLDTTKKLNQNTGCEDNRGWRLSIVDIKEL